MIPVRLIIENFFSHRFSEIDFSQFNSALLIGNTEGDYTRSNGSGKSAIFESILWCLFNKSRVAMMDDIIRWGENTCQVSFDFINGGKTYRVVRKRNRSNSSSTVEFLVFDEFGEWKDISCSTSGDTNSKIESTIKLDYKTFVNSVYFRQNDISEFAESEPSKKKEILKSIVDISRWDEYEKEAKRKGKDIVIECKVLKKSIEEYDEIIQKIRDSRDELERVSSEHQDLLSKKESIDVQISNLLIQYDNLKKSLDTDTYDKIVEDLKSLNAKKIEVQNSLKDGDSYVAKKSSELLSLQTTLNDLRVKIEGLKHIDVPQDKMQDLNNQMTYCLSQQSTAEEMLSMLEGTRINEGTCYVCNQSVDDVLHAKLLHKHNSKIEEYKYQYNNFKEEITHIETEIKKWSEIIRVNSVIDNVGSKIESEKFKIKIIEENLSKANEKVSTLRKSLEQIEFEIATNNSTLDSIKNDDFQSLRKNISSLKEMVVTCNSSILEKSKMMGVLSERIAVLTRQSEKMEASKKEMDKKMTEAAVFERLSRIFGKNGIQTILLDAIIEDLEKTSNKILNSICNEPSIIVLETQRVGSDGSSTIETLDLKIRKDGHLQNFKSLSGGEKFRISLALRIALSDVSSRYGGSSLDFLLLDEVNSPLDRHGVETLFVNVIKSLEDRYKMLVITHDESLKEKFDNVIDVTKINGESQVDFVSK
jgi:exonuclease SbcC